MRVAIFDLDGTVVDSSHRHVAKPDGSFCLDGWIKNCTPEKILQDQLLPLADYWREVKRAGSIVIVCTARVMQQADFQFLKHHGLHFNRCLSRAETDTSEDADLKVRNLLSTGIDFRKVSNVFWEDNASVRLAMPQLGINALHPEEFR